MPVIGILTALGLLVCLRDWRVRMPWLLSLGLAAPVSSALPAGAPALPAIYLIAFVLVVLCAWDWVFNHPTFPTWAGSTLIVVFVGWTALITLAGPTLFDGIGVYTAQFEASDGRVALFPLTYTGSNAAQLIYILVAVALLFALASRLPLSRHVLLPGLFGCMALSLWRLVSEKTGILPFPVSAIDSGNLTFIDGTATGDYRLRGVFSEPSGLAHYATGAMALGIVMLFMCRGRIRIAYAALAGMAGINLIYAHSGTGLIGGGLVLVLAFGLVAARAIRNNRGFTELVVLACAGLVAALFVWRPIVAYASGLINDKVGSTSYNERTGWDLYSLKLTTDTFGLGVGIGSNRPSTLWPTLLSCTGIIGTALFIAFLIAVLGRASRVPAAWPAMALAMSVLITRSVAGGSFVADPLLWVALGICANLSGLPTGETRETMSPALSATSRRGSLRSSAP